MLKVAANKAKKEKKLEAMEEEENNLSDSN